MTPPASAVTETRLPVVRFCTWCKEICFRPVEPRPTDAVLISVYNGERQAFWNGRLLTIADGICEKCRAKKFSEFPIKPAAATPAEKEHQP